MINPKSVRRAAGVVAALVLAIMGVAMYVSYWTLVDFLEKYGLDEDSAHLIPLTVDALAVAAVIAHVILPKGHGRGYALFVSAIGVGAAVAGNVGGAPNWVYAGGHAWPVVAYLLGELLIVKLLAYAARLETGTGVTVAPNAKDDKAVEQTAVTEVKADDAQAPDLPEAPVSPAAPRKRGPYKGRDRYSERHAQRLAKLESGK